MCLLEFGLITFGIMCLSAIVALLVLMLIATIPGGFTAQWIALTLLLTYVFMRSVRKAG